MVPQPPQEGVRLSKRREEVLIFVSSNAWDVAGAKAFGYQVAWCNRNQAPEEELGVRADVTISRLDQLSQQIKPL